MNCPDCGLENPPVHDACAFCDEPLAAGGRHEEWEKLSPKLREEFSRNFERALAARRDWRERHRRARWMHAATGAVLAGVLLALTHGPISNLGAALGFLVFILDAAAGAACGLALHHVRGGEYRGMMFFGGIYAASTSLKLALGAFGLSMYMGFFIMPGMFAALCFGYLFGLNMSMRRTIDE